MSSRYYAWRHGDVHYHRCGLGDPLLLVHNIYPGASHEEFTHNFEDLGRRFTVYAIDLLGFGDSAAPRLKYTASLYVDLLCDFARDVIGKPTHVMAAGLSCAYVTDAAATTGAASGMKFAADSDEAGIRTIRDTAAARFDRLVFICPRSEPTGLDLPRWVAPIRHFMLTAPGLGRGYYETVASEFAIRHYLRNCFCEPRHVTPELVDRLHQNAWRPGSINSYAGLLTGYLDSPLLDSLPRVSNPILLVWGREARPTPVEHSVRLLALARNCRLRVVEAAGSWVHDEQSAAVGRLVVQYLNDELPEPAQAQTA